MAFCSPSRKLSAVAVVHVGSVRGVGRPAHQPVDCRHELHGDALDVCHHILTQTTSVTESLNIRVTKDAVDDNGDRGWESVTLAADSACIVVSNDYSLFMLILVFTTFSLK